jgi:hypothetical protein
VSLIPARPRAAMRKASVKAGVAGAMALSWRGRRPVFIQPGFPAASRSKS